MADGENAVVLRPPPKHFTSKVWKLFGFNTLPGKTDLDMTHAVCRLCEALVKYSGNTTNLGQHLTRHHPEQKANNPVSPTPPPGTDISCPPEPGCDSTGWLFGDYFAPVQSRLVFE